MSQLTFTLYFWRGWRKRLFNLYWFRWGGSWAFAIRLGPLGVELNNNAVWTLSERCCK